MTEKNQSRSLERSQHALLLSMVLRMVLSFFLAMLLGRVLSPEDLGFYALVGSIFLISREILDFGTGNLATREIARDPECEPVLLGHVFWLRLMGAAGLSALCLFFSFYQEGMGRRGVVLLSIAGLMLLPLASYGPVFQARQAYGKISALGVLVQAGTLVGALLFHVLGVIPALFPVLVVLREVLGSLGTRMLGVRHLANPLKPLRPRGSDWGFFRRSFRYGVASALYTNLVHLAGLIIWFVIGDAALGAYSAALRPLLPIFMVPWALMNPLIAPLSSLSGKDEDAFRDRACKGLTVSLNLGLVGAVTGYFLAPAFIKLLYGGNYLSGAFDIVPAFQLLCAAFAFLSISSALVTILMARGRETVLLWIAVIGLVVMLAGNLWGLPRMGFVASAWTILVTEAVIFLAGCAAVGKSGGFFRDREMIIRGVLPAVFLGALMFLLKSTALLFPVGGLLACLAAISVWVKPNHQKEGQDA